MSKQDIVTNINEELITRFIDGEDANKVIDFITIALGNFFTTDQLTEFYEFIKEE